MSEERKIETVKDCWTAICNCGWRYSAPNGAFVESAGKQHLKGSLNRRENCTEVVVGLRSVAMRQAWEEKLVREAFDNFPEAATSMRCVKWKYDQFAFTFVDEDDDTDGKAKVYHVDLDTAVRGLRLFFAAVDGGSLPGLGLPAHYKKDTGTWDALAFDALLQFCTLGEVIYG